MNTRKKRNPNPGNDIDGYICSSCELIFPTDHYKHFRGKRYSYCPSCTKIKRASFRAKNKSKERINQYEWYRENLASPEAITFYFKRHIGQYRARALKLDIAFDLDVEFLVTLYNNQKGLCFYTNKQMGWDNKGKSKRNIMSLDRVDPDKGYTKGNVVLCTYQCNTFKSYMARQQFYDFCRLILKSESNPIPLT